MEEQILQKYIFPRERELIFGSCDFHLERDNSNEEDSYSSSIPITLKELSESKKEPYLILFYFNKDKNILEEWENLGAELSGDEIKLDDSLDTENKNIPKVRFRCINLDYEKKLHATFKNIKISSPYYWAKYFSNEQRYFILFYLNTFPVEFFNDVITEKRVREKYYNDKVDNYYGKFLLTNSVDGRKYLEEQKEKKFKAFDSLKLKGKYFKALQDNKPFAGVVKGRYYKIIETSTNDFKLFEL